MYMRAEIGQGSSGEPGQRNLLQVRSLIDIDLYALATDLCPLCFPLTTLRLKHTYDSARAWIGLDRPRPVLSGP